jgi:hypothetical protein
MIGLFNKEYVSVESHRLAKLVGDTAGDKIELRRRLNILRPLLSGLPNNEQSVSRHHELFQARHASGIEYQRIEVVIVKATNLPSVNVSGCRKIVWNKISNDPFCRVHLTYKNQIHDTSVQHNTSDPRWVQDMPLIFEISNTEKVGSIYVTVRDYENLGRSLEIGSVEFEIDEIIAKLQPSLAHPNQPKYAVVTCNLTYSSDPRFHGKGPSQVVLHIRILDDTVLHNIRRLIETPRL